MTQATKQEAWPLTWPDGWPRTRFQDRKAKTAWKKTANDYREALIRELERMGAITVIISTNVPLNVRGHLQAGQEPRDPSVAVYFKRQTKEDFSWQDVLGVTDPSATLDQIDAAYRAKAQIHHPDRGGDKETWLALAKAHRAAKDWLTGRNESAYDYVIACDAFTQVRWNLQALRQSIAALRTLESNGCSSLLERAFKGLAQLPQTAGEGNNATATTAAGR